MKRAAVLVFSLLLAFAASGCLFSPDPRNDPPPPPPTMPFPDTPDQLMANFKTAYGGMRIDDYRDVIAPGYQFILLPDDVVPGAADHLDFTGEMHVAEVMFSGNAVPHADGTSTPGIGRIMVNELTQAASWSETGAGDPDFPLTKRSLYRIRITFERAGSSSIVVTGEQEFFVSARDSVVNGATRPFYQLRGQRDLSSGDKGVEPTTWGALKLEYR